MDERRAPKGLRKHDVNTTVHWLLAFEIDSVWKCSALVNFNALFSNLNNHFETIALRTHKKTVYFIDPFYESRAYHLVLCVRVIIIAVNGNDADLVQLNSCCCSFFLLRNAQKALQFANRIQTHCAEFKFVYRWVVCAGVRFCVNVDEIWSLTEQPKVHFSIWYTMQNPIASHPRHHRCRYAISIPN